MRFFTVSKFSYNISGQIGTIGEREIMRLIIAILLYFLLRRIWKNFKNRIEKLDEYNGEFIFTFFSKFWKKEIYFNLSEIQGVLFTRISISGGLFKQIVVNIYLNDGYMIKIQKKSNCISFLKSCKENNEVLYEKILKSMPMGLDVSSIIEKEIENLKRMENRQKK